MPGNDIGRKPGKGQQRRQRRSPQRAIPNSAQPNLLLKSSSASPSTATATHTLRRVLPNFRWENVGLEPYKTSARQGGEFRGASRQVLIGNNGEPVKFHVRYFELEPGGFTSLERHRHCHVVIGARGRGRVRVDRTRYLVGPMDIIYIAPNEPHQLSTAGRGKFGFFCIVDAGRDKPRSVDE